MNWQELTSEAGVDRIIEESSHHYILIFKHSTRCSISSMALSRFERQWQEHDMAVLPYFLDLLSFRNVSNYIASKFNVEHQSPQVLLVKNGKCIYNASHNAISCGELALTLNS